MRKVFVFLHLHIKKCLFLADTDSAEAISHADDCFFRVCFKQKESQTIQKKALETKYSLQCKYKVPTGWH